MAAIVCKHGILRTMDICEECFAEAAQKLKDAYIKLRDGLSKARRP